MTMREFTTTTTTTMELYEFSELSEAAKERACSDNWDNFSSWYFDDMVYFCREYLNTLGYSIELIELLNIEYANGWAYSDKKEWLPTDFVEYFNLSEREKAIIDTLTFKKGLVILKESNGDATFDYIKLDYDFYGGYNGFCDIIETYVNQLSDYLNDLIREYSKYIEMYKDNASDVQYESLSEECYLYDKSGQVLGELLGSGEIELY